ncbi:tol-pal system protein YbgF [Candidatus Magnetoovum chiemensis]|nr:tol-pal system protein YbgF [Candidatus Magnetoovum chiemensis]
MSNYKYAAIIIILMLTSCATDGDVIRNDILNLKRNQAAQRGDIREIQEQMEKTRHLRESQEELYGKLDNFSKDLQQLQGRYEESKYHLEKSMSAGTTDIDIVRAQIETLNTKMTNIEAALKEKGIAVPEVTMPSDTSTAPDTIAAAPMPPSTSPVGTTSPTNAAAAPRPTAPPVEAAPLTEQEAYERAYKEFLAGHFKDSRNQFSNFINKYPNGKYIANAYFWRAECDFKDSKYEDAIVGYQDMIKRFQSSDKVPGAKLKQGLAFIEINDKDTAIAIFKQLIKQYPNAKETEIARIKLKSLEPAAPAAPNTSPNVPAPNSPSGNSSSLTPDGITYFLSANG